MRHKPRVNLSDGYIYIYIYIYVVVVVAVFLLQFLYLFEFKLTFRVYSIFNNLQCTCVYSCIYILTAIAVDETGILVAVHLI